MGLAHGVNIVKDGLVFSVDAANPRSYPGSGDDIDGTSGMIGTYGGGNKRSPTIYFAGGNIGWEFGNLSGQNSGVTFPIGFENYVITYDSSFNVVIYAGGVQIDSGTSTSIANFWDYFTIGKYGNYSSLYMGGKFGCVSVYNRALSASEVTQNYNALIE